MKYTCEFCGYTGSCPACCKDNETGKEVVGAIPIVFHECLSELSGQIQRIKNELSKTIQTLPQNPRIKEVGPATFTLKASDLGTTNWSASYHDFRPQYRALVELIQSGSPDTILPRLRAALKKGSLKQINLHPDVVAHVKGLL